MEALNTIGYTNRVGRIEGTMQEIGLCMREKEKVNSIKKLFAALAHIPENAPELEKLIGAKFTRMPASIKHHGNMTGGLLLHSLCVAKELCQLTDKLGLVWKKDSSPFVIGMLHDLCKLYTYTEIENGPLTHWDYSKEKSLYPGHGVRSVLIADDMGFKLTEEEKLCIIYHMGAFDKDLQSGYSAAVSKNPNILWTHTADMVASQVLNF